MPHDSRVARTLVRFALPAAALLVWSTHAPAQAHAPARTQPLASAPAPSLPGTPPLDTQEYRLRADLWPKDPALGGLLGGAIGCASGAFLGRILSPADRRTRNAWSGCFFLGAVGMGAGSGWRVPGDPYFRPG